MKMASLNGGHGISMNIFYFTGRRWHAALALAIFLAAPVRAAAPELPPLNDPPTDARLPGKFVWVDLLTPDVARAEAFYGKLSVGHSARSGTATARTRWRF